MRLPFLLKTLTLITSIMAAFGQPLYAQDPASSSVPSSSPIPAGTETKIKKPKMRYRAISLGLSMPMGEFGDDTYTAGFEGAGAGKTGALLEFSNLRLFNQAGAEHGAAFGWTTQIVASANLTKYDLPGTNPSGGSINFAQIKMGPSLVLVSRPKLLFDLGATVGYSFNLISNLYYSYNRIAYSTDGNYRFEYTYYGYPYETATNAFTFGLNGNFRAGALLLGLELNFLKTKFSASNTRDVFIYNDPDSYFVDNQTASYDADYKFPLSTFRFKIGLEW